MVPDLVQTVVSGRHLAVRAGNVRPRLGDPWIRDGRQLSCINTSTRVGVLLVSVAAEAEKPQLLRVGQPQDSWNSGIFLGFLLYLN